MEKKEAMKILKDFHDKSALFSVRTALDTVFPEFVESEDEKIRKALIKGVESVCKDDEIFTDGFTRKQIVAWLEKQKDMEAKLIISDEGYNKAFQDGIEEVLTNSHKYGLEKQGEQKPSEWNTNDEQMLNSTIKDLIHPCYEEIPDRIEEEIKWIKSMRNRVVSQPKQEWSEEDEKMFEHIIAKATLHFSSINCLDEEEINFLKSLRHQPHWKPSDGQMEILNEVLNFAANHESPHWNDYIFGTLNNLIRQLKKLREK